MSPFDTLLCEGWVRELGPCQGELQQPCRWEVGKGSWPESPEPRSPDSDSFPSPDSPALEALARSPSCREPTLGLPAPRVS